MGLEKIELTDEQREKLLSLSRSHKSREKKKEGTRSILTDEQRSLLKRVWDGEPGFALLISNLPVEQNLPPTPASAYGEEFKSKMANITVTDMIIDSGGKYKRNHFEAKLPSAINGLETAGVFHFDSVNFITTFYCLRSLPGAKTTLVDMAGVFGKLEPDEINELCKNQFYLAENPSGKNFPILEPDKYMHNVTTLAVRDIMTTGFISARESLGGKAEKALRKFSETFMENMVEVELQPGQSLVFDEKQREIKIPGVGKAQEGWLHRGPDKWQEIPEDPGEYRWLAFSTRSRTAGNEIRR